MENNLIQINTNKISEIGKGIIDLSYFNEEINDIENFEKELDLNFISGCIFELDNYKLNEKFKKIKNFGFKVKNKKIIIILD